MKRKWDYAQLDVAVSDSISIRQVLQKLGLRPAGGNYEQIKNSIAVRNLDVSHFRGKGWSKGIGGLRPRIATELLLVKNSTFQSHKLKQRLFAEGLKKQECELCGWAQQAPDGRIPLELDHENGDRHDNRIRNLRILCPNCHSLQETHRGLNIARKGEWRNR